MGTQDTKEIQVAPEDLPTQARACATGPAPEPAEARAAVAEGRPEAATPEVGAPPIACAGLELLGQLDGSGFEETPYLVRRPDGQVVQLPGILYALVELIDGRRDAAAIGQALSEKIGKGIDADGVTFLIDEKLRPLGVVGEPDGSQPDVEKKEDLLGLTVRAKVVPPRLVQALTTVFRPLFWPPVVIAVIAGLVALDAWLVLDHGIAQGIRSILYHPGYLVALFAGVVVATAWHEVGHATACRYGGGRPGALGVGIYVIWPVMFSDVTDAYRLDRGARLRTDLGGVYFNAVFALLTAGAYALTGFEPLIILIMVQSFAIMQQLLPLGRLDGYLVLSDLTGVPDLLTRLGPILRSALPWRETEPEVTDLKPWVRRVATAYVALLVPALLAILTLMVMHAPRVFATAADSAGVQWDKVTAGIGDGGNFMSGMGALLQLVALLTPCIGAVVTTVRISSRIGRGAASWAEGSPPRHALVYVVGAAALAFIAFTWWPNGEYRPIQPGERGTLQAGFRSFAGVASGRPALSSQRRAELRDAPTVRSGKQKIDAGDSSTTEQTTKERVVTGPDGEVTTLDSTTTTGSTAPPAATTTAPAPPAATQTTTTTTPATTDTTTTTAPATTGTTPTTTDTTTTTTPTTTTTTTP
jgi:putative peptide zinc metalloprotease protein